jgi:hypothetical protein
MYVSPWMQACLLPRKWDVCGIVCPPLSLWHHYILRRNGNRYLAGVPGTDRDAATEVLMYASGGIEHGRRLYLEKFYRTQIRNRIAAAVRKADWEDVDAAVCEYVCECIRIPSHKRAVSKDGGAVKFASAPSEWILAEYAAGGDPARMDAAWDSPYAMTVCMYDARRSASGEDESLIDEDREEVIDRKVAEREKRKAVA